MQLEQRLSELNERIHELEIRRDELQNVIRYRTPKTDLGEENAERPENARGIVKRAAANEKKEDHDSTLKEVRDYVAGKRFEDAHVLQKEIKAKLGIQMSTQRIGSLKRWATIQEHKSARPSSNPVPTEKAEEQETAGRRSKYTPEIKDFIRENYETLDNNELSDKLKEEFDIETTYSRLAQLLSKMGLKRSTKQKVEIRSAKGELRMTRQTGYDSEIIAYVKQNAHRRPRALLNDINLRFGTHLKTSDLRNIKVAARIPGWKNIRRASARDGLNPDEAFDDEPLDSTETLPDREIDEMLGDGDD